MIVIRNKTTNSVWVYRKIGERMYVSFDFASNRPDDGYTHRHAQEVNSYTALRDGLQRSEEIIYDSGEERSLSALRNLVVDGYTRTITVLSCNIPCSITAHNPVCFRPMNSIRCPPSVHPCAAMTKSFTMMVRYEERKVLHISPNIS